MNDFLTRFQPVFDGEAGGAPAAPAPAPAPAPEPAPAPAPSGDEPPSFLDSIADPDARGLVEKKGYKDANDIAVAYRHLVQLHGNAPNVFAMPETDDADGWSNLYNRMGRPDKPENYTYTPPEGVETDTEFLNAMKAKAHEIGITQKQFEALAAANDALGQEAVDKFINEQKESTETQVADLQKAFGGEQAFNTAKLAGKSAVKALGLDDTTLDALDANIGVPAVMKLLAIIGTKVASEADFLEGIDVNGNGLSPQAAKAELDRLKGDADFQTSLLTPTHANHKTNTAKWNDLQRLAFSGGKR